MNCREAERRIYLYAELTSRDREETEKHIASCPACRGLSKRVADERKMMGDMLRTRHVAPDPLLLTQRIMSRVEQTRTEKITVISLLNTTVFGNTLRYVMAVLSTILITTFIAEYTTTPATNTPYVERTAKSILNSASFLEALKENDPTKRSSSVYQCVMSCLQAQDGTCSECSTKFSNLIKKHEAI